MTTKLKELAAVLRAKAAEDKAQKSEKCANIIKAASGLKLLDQKIRGKNV